MGFTGERVPPLPRGEILLSPWGGKTPLGLALSLRFVRDIGQRKDAEEAARFIDNRKATDARFLHGRLGFGEAISQVARVDLFRHGVFHSEFLQAPAPKLARHADVSIGDHADQALGSSAGCDRKELAVAALHLLLGLPESIIGSTSCREPVHEFLDSHQFSSSGSRREILAAVMAP
jgi:hypothetical protein